MTAKEMFEELGFKEYSNDNISISYKYNANRKNTNYMIVFYFSDNTYQVFTQSYSSRLLKENKYLPIYEPYRINTKLNKAIQQQIKELHWEE